MKKERETMDSRGNPVEKAMDINDKKTGNLVADGSVHSGKGASLSGGSSNFADSDSQRSGKEQLGEDEELMTPAIAAKEAKAVWATKALVALVLLVSAGSLAYFSFTYSRKQENSDFQAKFLNYADEIRRSGIENAEDSYMVLRSYSRIITSFASFSNETRWPFITIPDYEVRANDLEVISGTEELAFAPIVTDEYREAYEAYTQRNQGWIQTGLDYEFMQSLEEQKKQEQSDESNSDLEQEQEQSKTETIAPGTNMEGFSTINKAKPIQPFIWKNAPLTNRAIPETSKGPHVPLWQTYPAPRNSYVVNRNLLSEPAFEELIMKSIHNYTTVLSDVFDNFALFGRSQSIDLDPKSVVIEPILSSLKPGARDIRGFLIAVKKWDKNFRHVLYKGAEPIVCVLRNSCGKSFSYEIIGPQAIFLGQGDLHDTDYNHMELSASFSHPEVQSDCAFSIHIYPTKEMEAAYKTSMPLYVTLAVLLVFGFTSLVFLLYDFFVTKRQRTTMASANATNRIVSNLFPKAVRDRLIQEMEAQDADNHSVMSGNSGLHSNHSIMGGRKKKKNAFLNMTMQSSNHGKSTASAAGTFNGMGTSEDIFGSKPIAELFPETTIMFADMVGFTAWSSVRDPTQVFTLLETIYHAFDTVAKRRRVFKVETIGDCYVAVAGLPMPRKDHATVMARFASECLAKMEVLTKNLEATLGPDTGDLSLRIGLHSGQVTAGVLRGEKGRFQLFGDTMNTASRMESTGQRGKIQVSSETADLLRKKGKEDWLIKREEMVHAKGKGELQTYWVRIGSGSDLDTSSVASNNDLLDGLDDEDATLTEIDKKEDAQNMMKDIATAAKSLRLIDWNTEILSKLLKQIVLRRAARRIKKKQLGLLGLNVNPVAQPANNADFEFRPRGLAIDEVTDIISLPHYDPKNFAKNVDPDSVEIPEAVLIQLKSYVSRIAGLYRDNPFHNFEHASHVTMSVTKLLSRIINPLQGEGHAEQDKLLHDHTFGITSDPLTQFTCVLSALIHDADHPGVSNAVLVNEKDPMAIKYKELSIAEQNSIDLAWQILMEDQFKDLRSLIYTNADEFKRFRQILVNVVLATDIMDKNLGAQRKARWNKAFNSSNLSDSGVEVFGSDEPSGEFGEEQVAERNVNRKATIVLEHLIQASDVSHTMQHWHVYQKWNEKLFHEMYKAFLEGRLDNDPSISWYKGEIGFFDFYIIPLAKKLETCGVFGVSSMEYLSYAEANRREWERKGESIVEGYLKQFQKEG